MNAAPPLILTPRRSRGAILLTLLSAALLPESAHASMFHGETLDSIANVISWVALVIAPLIGIGPFLARPYPAGKDRP